MNVSEIKTAANIFIALTVAMALLFFAACDGDEDPVLFRDVPQDQFWETTNPASENMDEAVLAEIESMVSGSDGVYSFLIARNGKIVHEQYHHGAGQNALLHIRSITKRITSSLIGIGIDKGNIPDQHALIGDYFPELEQGTGQGWDEVSVYHLLNMISGMAWVENNELNAYEDKLADPLTFIFSKDIAHEPGTYYAYNTPGTDLLPYLMERTSQHELADFSEENLFGPLGILGYEWEKIGDGVERGGAGLQLTARDLAKIGLLYLQDGQWQGRQVVSETWIQQCFNDPIALDDLEGDHLPGISIGQSWWARDIHGKRVHYGDGYGGQILMVVPEYQIVIVMNHAYKVDPAKNNAAFGLFFNEILPGVFDSITG